ncbi:MAG: hypothetical protein PWQ52_895 [Methanolobus sp.]|nr:hypothetical protein [Methanolobus sp.]
MNGPKEEERVLTKATGSSVADPYLEAEQAAARPRLAGPEPRAASPEEGALPGKKNADPVIPVDMASSATGPYKYQHLSTGLTQYTENTSCNFNTLVTSLLQCMHREEEA